MLLTMAGACQRQHLDRSAKPDQRFGGIVQRGARGQDIVHYPDGIGCLCLPLTGGVIGQYEGMAQVAPPGRTGERRLSGLLAATPEQLTLPLAAADLGQPAAEIGNVVLAASLHAR